MIHYTRLTGLMLAFVFGSQLLFLNLRQTGIARDRTELKQNGEHIFARITRTQRMQKLSPFIQPRYYFSIEGNYQNNEFQKSERVPPEFYHLYSVGSNIEVTTSNQSYDRFISHIRNNKLPYGEKPALLFNISRILFYTGLILSLFGFLLGPFLGKFLPGTALKTVGRPPIKILDTSSQ